MEGTTEIVDTLASLGVKYPLWKAEFLRFYRVLLEGSEVLSTHPPRNDDGSITFADEADLVEYVMRSASLAAMAGIFGLESARRLPHEPEAPLP